MWGRAMGKPSRKALKQAVSKAAASEDPEAYPLGYVEGLNDARTQLAGCFSALLRASVGTCDSLLKHRA